jgi:hypothetical protein
VSAKRTAWHFFFAILLRARGPRWLEVRDEVPLSEERPRIDYLLLRKLVDAATAEDRGQTLRDLWPHLPLVTVAELKSVGRPYRKRALDRLWSYVHAYWADEANGLTARRDLCALLVVPNVTPTLHADVKEMGLTWKDLGGGYWELTGGLFQLYVADVDAVAEHEDDDMLRLFGHAPEHTAEARRFWTEQVGTKEAMMAVQELEEYDEVVQRFLDLVPLQLRLKGLDREQILLALPDDELRLLPETYLATFSEPTRAAVRKRLGRAHD